MKTRITELLGIEEPVIQGGIIWLLQYLKQVDLVLSVQPVLHLKWFGSRFAR